MYAEIQSAIASAKVALDIAKAAHGLSNYNELVSAVSEVNAKLMDATVVTLSSLEKQSSLTSRITELENKLREVENWESQIKRYKLYQFNTGALAHKLQEPMQDGEPMHYLCTTCVNKREKTILQPHDKFLYCPICKSTIPTQEASPINYQQSGGGSNSWMA